MGCVKCGQNVYKIYYYYCTTCKSYKAKRGKYNDLLQNIKNELCFHCRAPTVQLLKDLNNVKR